MMISLEARLISELHAHVMSHLNLGRDAASMYRPPAFEPRWAAPLTAAYLQAEGRLSVQFIGLWARDLAHAVEVIEEGSLPKLGDEAGRALCHWMKTALEGEQERVYAQWLEDEEEREARLHAAAEVLVEPLTLLRGALWAGSEQPTPPLTVLHVPSMGKHARAMGMKQDGAPSRVVATSLNESWEQILCQVFHEEVHPVSDPAAYALQGQQAGAERDTHAGGRGYAIHQSIEKAAVELGQTVMAQVLPEQLPAYRQWRSHFERG